MGRELGVTEEQMRDLSAYRESPAFSPIERLVLDLAVAMADTPVEVPMELRARLRQNFSEAQLVELVATIAWENYRARFNRAFGIQAAGYTAGAFCVVSETRRQRPAGPSAS